MNAVYTCGDSPGGAEPISIPSMATSRSPGESIPLISAGPSCVYVCVCERLCVDVWWIRNADSFVCHHRKGKKSTELGGTLARSSLAQRRTGTTRAMCRNMEPPSSLMNTSPIPPRTSAIMSPAICLQIARLCSVREFCSAWILREQLVHLRFSGGSMSSTQTYQGVACRILNSLSSKRRSRTVQCTS